RGHQLDRHPDARAVHALAVRRRDLRRRRDPAAQAQGAAAQAHATRRGSRPRGPAPPHAPAGRHRHLRDRVSKAARAGEAQAWSELMAHVVVYLQRTTRGLHPGSMIALCIAREVADARGASVTSLCLGDAGAFDDRLIVEASRAGADQIVFLGPEGVQKLFRRLAPRHVFAPYTREAGSVLAQAGIGPMVGRWIGGPPGNPQRLEPVIGTIAGPLPWQQSPRQLEPGWAAEGTQAGLPVWRSAAAAQATTLTTTAGPPPLLSVAAGREGAPGELDGETPAALASLGAYAIQPGDYPNYGEG